MRPHTCRTSVRVPFMDGRKQPFRNTISFGTRVGRPDLLGPQDPHCGYRQYDYEVPVINGKIQCRNCRQIICKSPACGNQSLNPGYGEAPRRSDLRNDVSQQAVIPIQFADGDSSAHGTRPMRGRVSHSPSDLGTVSKHNADYSTACQNRQQQQRVRCCRCPWRNVTYGNA